jgi:hypothetical protein
MEPPLNLSDHMPQPPALRLPYPVQPFRRHLATAFIVVALWWPAIVIDLRGVEPGSLVCNDLVTSLRHAMTSAV